VFYVRVHIEVLSLLETGVSFTAKESQSSMQITFIASGSRGDVQPYVALGTGFKTAGHAVRVVAPQDYQNLVTSHGLEFAGMGGNVQAIAQEMQALIEQGNMLKIMSKMGKAAEQQASESALTGLTACQDSDLIVGGLGGLFIGYALSQKLGIPFVQAYLYPFTRTREFASVLMPPTPLRLPGWANSLSHSMAQQMMWQTTRSADNKARAEILKMASAPFFGPFSKLNGQGQTILNGYSPQVIPPATDWADYIHVTGYWFLDPPQGWQPPTDLVDFLQAGAPPVYIGFGSMPNSKPEETVKMVLQALERSGQRGIISAGWGGLKGDDLPKTVHMVGSLPHSWLLPQMAAVVHHGGAGTTAAGLSAGVPSIVTPYFGDQPFWAQRVYELGVGTKPIARKALSVERLDEAIRIAVTDTAMREKAADLGQRIRAENGVARAVEVIEQKWR
jgi:sterol 3beta-glucosyltransferase